MSVRLTQEMRNKGRRTGFMIVGVPPGPKSSRRDVIFGDHRSPRLLPIMVN